MKWAYRRYAVGRSRICPEGIVCRPEAKVRVGGRLGNAYLRVLVDTGADHTVLPFSIAAVIGAELFENEPDEAKGFSGHEISIIPGKVELELLGDTESYKWDAVVGFARFASLEDECSILGHTGCLEFFCASFDGGSKLVELSPQRSFSSPV